MLKVITEDKWMEDKRKEPGRLADRFTGHDSIICLQCDKRSYSKDDIRHKFCGECGYHVHMSHAHAITDSASAPDGQVSWEVRMGHPQYPGNWFTARMNKPVDGLIKPTDCFIAACSLGEIRAILSKMCTFRFGRSESSEIELIETWV